MQTCRLGGGGRGGEVEVAERRRLSVISPQSPRIFTSYQRKEIIFLLLRLSVVPHCIYCPPPPPALSLSLSLPHSLSLFHPSKRRRCEARTLSAKLCHLDDQTLVF